MADNKNLAFDHRNILLHYKKWKESGGNMLVIKVIKYILFDNN